jgi:hypothetical protein
MCKLYPKIQYIVKQTTTMLSYQNIFFLLFFINLWERKLFSNNLLIVRWRGRKRHEIRLRIWRQQLNTSFHDGEIFHFIWEGCKWKLLQIKSSEEWISLFFSSSSLGNCQLNREIMERKIYANNKQYFVWRWKIV